MRKLGLYHIEAKPTLRKDINVIEEPDNVLFKKCYKTTNILRLISGIGIAYVVMICGILLSLYLVHIIPFGIIRPHVMTSAEILIKEGGQYDPIYHATGIGVGKHMFCSDGFTDAIMLSQACNIGKNDPFRSMMTNRCFFHDAPWEVIRLNVENRNVDSVIWEGISLTKGSYDRYWHGYLVALVPALTVMDLDQIRILNYSFFLVLIITISILTYRHINGKTSLAFLLTLLLTAFPVIPRSLQFSTVFYIAFLAVVVELLFRKLQNDSVTAGMFFFVVGGITSWADFLTAPIVTLGLPLIYHALLRGEHSNHIKTIIALSLFWGLGYAAVWGSKWALEWLTLGTDVFATVKSQAAMRLGEEIPLTHVLLQIVDLFPVYLVGPTLLFALAYFCIAKRSMVMAQQNLWLLLVAIIPILWLCTLKNHTSIHLWFSWRNMVVSFFAVFLFLVRSTSLHKITNLNKRLKHE